jgi:hypothetical protein
LVVRVFYTLMRNSWPTKSYNVICSRLTVPVVGPRQYNTPPPPT